MSLVTRWCWLLALLSMVGVAAADIEAARAKYNEARDKGSELEALIIAGIATPALQQEASRLAEAIQTDLSEAARLFDEAQAATSDAPPVLSDYADVLSRLGNHDLASEALRRAVDLAPEDTSLKIRLGLAYAKVGPARRSEAVAVLREVVEREIGPEDGTRVWYALGDIYHQEKLYAFAKEAYAHVLALEARHVLANIGMAALEVREGKILEAYRRLDQVGRAAQPHDAHVRVLLRDALLDFDTRRQSFADTPEHHAAYANLLYRAARIPEAIMVANRAVRMRPNDFVTFNFIAAMHLQLGNLKEGITAYEKSLAANPDQPGIRDQLKEVRAYMDQQEQGAGTAN